MDESTECDEPLSGRRHSYSNNTRRAKANNCYSYVQCVVIVRVWYFPPVSVPDVGSSSYISSPTADINPPSVFKSTYLKTKTPHRTFGIEQCFYFVFTFYFIALLLTDGEFVLVVGHGFEVTRV